ncbi:MAG TPA: ABC transporter permease subunit [Longimicrobiales bacterium]|nr:ABC transporter permease subunit [Longimicrobiales bacterium]
MSLGEASPVATLARLELSDVLRSRWLVACVAVYGILAALFLLVGLRESLVLGFTGMERVLLSLGHALIVLLPLLALIGAGFSVNRARQDGTLELLFAHPVERRDYLRATTLVRYLALVAPLVVLVPGLALGGRVLFGQPIPWAFVLRALSVTAALAWSFVGVGVAISVRASEPARAATHVLVVWLLVVALLDFGLVGLMLEWRLPAAAVFVLAALNPVEIARLALLSGAEPSLGTLGPVGFFLADTLGPGALLAAGVLWPLAVGTLAWLAARRALLEGDLL